MKTEEKAFGTYKIAEICHVTPATIGKWIKQGKLPAFYTAGGQRRVWRQDLISFLGRLQMPVPPHVESALASSVLIVDDDPAVRKLVRKVFSNLSAQTEIAEADTGFEAGRKVTDLVPRLVVLDLVLPGIDGFDVCREIRSDPRLKKTRILAISGYDVEESERKSLKAGAHAFLAKPLDVGELKKYFEKWVAK